MALLPWQLSSECSGCSEHIWLGERFLTITVLPCIAQNYGAASQTVVMFTYLGLISNFLLIFWAYPLFHNCQSLKISPTTSHKNFISENCPLSALVPSLGISGVQYSFPALGFGFGKSSSWPIAKASSHMLHPLVCCLSWCSGFAEGYTWYLLGCSW